jgi:putative zinc ribbon protein
MKEDIVIVCANCEQDFVWTKGEQEFYAGKKLEKPKYCMICKGMFGKANKDGFRGKSEMDNK